MSFFIYRSLTPHKKRIRLVHVLPENSFVLSETAEDVMYREQCENYVSQSSNNIFCTVSHVSLDSAPPYTALSYNWGDESRTKSIYIDGASSMITENLECALRHLRRPDKELTLWVDSLCIDQGDKEEKSEQVQQMREIYSRAISVLAWLGPEAESSNVAMDWIKDFGSRSSSFGIGTKPNLRLRYLRQADEKILVDLGGSYKQFIDDLKSELGPSNPQYYKVIFALKGVFSRPYWGRIWVVQELFTATKTSFVCGTKTVTEDELHHGLRLIRNFGHYRLLESSHEAQFGISDSNSILSIPTLAPINLLKIRRAATPLPLIHLLRSLRTSKAKLHQDKIFALLGIAEDSQLLSLSPDYDKPWQDVYIDAAEALISKGYIEVLSLCEASNRTPELPSWVPDWSHEIERSPIQQRTRNRVSASPTTILQPEFSASGPHHFSNGRVFRSGQGHLGRLSLSATFIGEVQSLGTTWVDGGLGTWLSDLQRLSQKSSQISKQSVQAQIVWRTAVADQEIRQGMIKPRLSNHMLSAVDELLANRDLRHVNSQTFIEAGLGDYVQQLQQIAQSRRPMLVGNGYVGIVPVETEPGDQVFIILGADVPHILRRRRQSESLLLIGEAYVHGVMDGEVMQGVTDIQTIEIS
ncbi:hypothetical protein BP5796_02679 [Coleophoma crateriformis]|uniref:Heterokaryon incompatibility domain-containing protein n=1 Tax=Coleophoma crateriformis TaxID=565419 RepID=A0A3D8SYZ6_9HELO|nr:hypothetical protein BP5796_02679 [Coleophoma crateriformis]